MSIADIAFSAVLALAAVMGAIVSRHARPAARAYMRFAAVLYMALAAGDAAAIVSSGDTASSFAMAVTFIVCALGPAALALSLFATFEHPPRSWSAAMLLGFALIAGIGAAIANAAVLSFSCLTASALAMLALSARRWRLEKRRPLYATIAALCLLAGSAAGLQAGSAGRTALMLFSAAGLLGLSLALTRRSHALVAEQGGKDLRLAAIGGPH